MPHPPPTRLLRRRTLKALSKTTSRGAGPGPRNRLLPILLLLAHGLAGCVVWPGGALTTDQRLNGATTLQAFASQKSALRFRTLSVHDGSGKQLGLATRYRSPRDLICKASAVTDHGSLQVRSPNGQFSPAFIAGVDAHADLALLRRQGADSTEREPSVDWFRTPPREGAWVSCLADLDTVKVGIVSGGVREIEEPDPMLGVILKLEQDEAQGGAMIETVIKRSAAHKARLKDGDRILAVNEEDIRHYRHLQRVLHRLRPGAKILLDYERSGRRRQQWITLGDETMTEGHDRNLRMSGPVSDRRAGFHEVFQHDCPLKPESMGGPVVDLEGRLIGVNIARSDRVTTFALTLSEVRRAMERIQSHLPN